MQVLNTLDALIGFAIVMLLLSMIVMFLVQATQMVIAQRQVALKKALYLLMSANKISSVDANDLIDKLFESKTLKSNKMFKLFKPDIEFSEDEINKILDDIPDDPKKDESETESREKSPAEEMRKYMDIVEKGEKGDFGKDRGFENVEKLSSHIYRSRMRIISFTWAFIVAFAYQVSTPELLRDLSVDPKLRLEAVSVVTAVQNKASEAIRNSDEAQDVSGEALARLASKHSNYAKQLEEVSGVGRDRAELIRELKLVLKGLPANDLEMITNDYSRSITELQDERFDQGMRDLRVATEDLARFNIGLWNKGISFYDLREDTFRAMKNIIGVILTALLLSLGAPFWYERLKDLVHLRSALAKKLDTKKN